MKATAKTLRPYPLRRLLIIVAATLPMLAFAVLLSNRGWTWMVGALAGMSILGMIGVIEVFVERVDLHEAGLVIVGLLGKRRHDRADFDRVTLEAGHVSLHRVDGTWLILPEVGRSPRALRGAVDTWLRRSP
jgi:hypothetical protein